jgi:hypothetical protein
MERAGGHRVRPAVRCLAAPVTYSPLSNRKTITPASPGDLPLLLTCVTTVLGEDMDRIAHVGSHKVGIG